MIGFLSQLDVARDVVLIAAASVGTLTLEHGWKWIKAKALDYWQRAKNWEQQHASQAADVFKEVTSQVDAATKLIKSEIDGIKDRISALETSIKK